MQTLEQKREQVVSPKVKLWTGEECDALVQNGLLKGRYELIEGMIIDKMGSGGRHALFVSVLMALLMRLFGGERVRVQLPIRILGELGHHNEPEPDLAVTQKRHRAYPEHPLTEDLLLVAEVSDSSLRYDLAVKARLYAQTGIPEYWVIDTDGESLILHREPTSEGYQQVTTLKVTDSLSPLSVPAISFALSELFAGDEAEEVK